MSGPIRDLAERFWSGTVPPGQLWKATGRTEELSPGIIFAAAARESAERSRAES